MKKNKLYILTYLLLLIGACGQTQNNTFEKKEIGVIKDFYVNYIRILSSGSSAGLSRKLDSLQQRYCTKKLIADLKNDSTLDWDPFLKAQAISTEALKTLSIKKGLNKISEYIVTYKWDGVSNKDTTRIHLTVIQNKIDSVW